MLTRRALVVIAPLYLLTSAHADEGGVSFSLPGQQSSLAAVQGAAGWSIPVVYYHTSSDAGSSKQFVVGGNLVAGLDAEADLVFVAPTYTFGQPVLGGQGSFTLTVAGGHMRVGVDARLSGPGGSSIAVSRTDSLTGFADLYSTGTVKWTNGVHNAMAYVAGGCSANPTTRSMLKRAARARCGDPGADRNRTHAPCRARTDRCANFTFSARAVAGSHSGWSENMAMHWFRLACSQGKAAC